MLERLIITALLACILAFIMAGTFAFAPRCERGTKSLVIGGILIAGCQR